MNIIDLIWFPGVNAPFSRFTYKLNFDIIIWDIKFNLTSIICNNLCEYIKLLEFNLELNHLTITMQFDSANLANSKTYWIKAHLVVVHSGCKTEESIVIQRDDISFCSSYFTFYLLKFKLLKLVFKINDYSQLLIILNSIK